MLRCFHSQLLGGGIFRFCVILGIMVTTSLKIKINKLYHMNSFGVKLIKKKKSCDNHHLI